MTIKVLSYHAEPYGEHQLGFCKVDVKNKCQIILKVFKSKAGNICCCFTNVKLNGEWQSTFSFSDRDYERKFLNECREQVQVLIEHEAQFIDQKTENQEDFPF